MTKFIMASACLAQIMVILDTTIIAVALPNAQKDLGFGDSIRQWTVTAYTIVFGSLLLLGGRISQRIGIRAAFLIGLAGFASASVLGGLAANTPWLLAARAAQGAFAALLAPTNLSLMNVAFPGDKKRGRAFAIFGVVAGAGAATGLILGGVLTECLSWRWCLFVSMPIAGAASIVAAPTLHQLPDPQPLEGEEDLLGLLLGSASVFGMVFGLSRADSDGWNSRLVLSLLMGGCLLLGAFLWRESTARNPMLPLHIMRDFVRGASYLCIAGVGLAQMGASLYLTFYFQTQLGYSPTKTGLMFLPLVGGLIVAAPLTMRWILPRFGVIVAYPLGALAQASGFGMLSTLGKNIFGQGMVVPLVIAGFGIGLVMAPAMSLATAGTPARYSGVASATANTCQQLGASLGVAFLSTWASRHVTNGIQGREASLKAEAMAALERAAVPPTSPQGQAIVDGIKQAALNDEILTAYRSGFIVIGIAALGVCVLSFLILMVGRRRSGEQRNVVGI